MIILKRLTWSNCFSYGADNELDLSANLVTQLVGTNGVGKSSIPLIIEEVLYNKNSKGIKKSDIPNRYVDAGYSICLEFSKDSDEYVVSEVRKTSLKVSLKKNGEEISSHTATNTYKTIQEIIGVDFKTFSQLVYQNTNASLQFLTATDANRKRFLIDLLHLEEYTKLFEIFKEEARNAATTLVQEQTKINTYESWLKDNTLEDSDMSQNFGFISFPDALTTGSSIMPHKKNPDVFELIRGKCNKIQALHTEMLLITNNLPTGYHRDFQLLKENIINAFEDVKEILDILNYAIQQVIVKDIDLKDESASRGSPVGHGLLMAVSHEVAK